MIPRPIYRWKSLWLGVFILLFLMWSWITGITVNRWAAISTPKFTMTPAQYEGMLGVAVDVRRSMWGMVGEVIEPRRVRGDWFPAPWEVEIELNPPGYHWPFFRLRFAHWFLIVLFLIPWSAFLAWHWRRMKRAGSAPLD